MTDTTRAFTPARLVALSTSDGMIDFSDDVPLGRIYRVDLSTRVKVTLFNLERQVSHVTEIVQDESGGWLPMECLKVLVN